MNPVTGLSLGRIGFGLAALVKPDLVQGGMAMPANNPLLTRWFGSREVALGTATLLASGRSRAALVVIGMAVDGADAATAYAAIEAEQLPRKLGLVMTGVAGGAVISGLLGLRVKRKVKAPKGV